MHKYLLVVLAFAAISFACNPVDFCVYVLEDYNCTNTYVEGRLAAGRDIRIGNVTLGCQIYNPNRAKTSCIQFGSELCADHQNDEPTIVTGRNAYVNSARLVVGRFFYGKSISQTKLQMVCDCDYKRVDWSSYIVQAIANLRSYSAYFGGWCSTGTTTISQQGKTCTFASTSSGPVFAMQSTTADDCANWNLNVPTSATGILFNIYGTNPVINACTLNAQFSSKKSKIIYNFPDATTLTLNNCNLIGTVLAPKAAIVSNGGSVLGQIYGKSYAAGSGTCGACKWNPFDGDFPSNVCPSTSPTTQTSKALTSSTSAPTSAPKTSTSTSAPRTSTSTSSAPVTSAPRTSTSSSNPPAPTTSSSTSAPRTSTSTSSSNPPAPTTSSSSNPPAPTTSTSSSVRPAPTTSSSSNPPAPTTSTSSSNPPAPTTSSSSNPPAPTTSTSSSNPPAPTTSSSSNPPAPTTSTSSSNPPAPTTSSSSNPPAPTTSSSSNPPAPTTSTSSSNPPAPTTSSSSSNPPAPTTSSSTSDAPVTSSTSDAPVTSSTSDVPAPSTTTDITSSSSDDIPTSSSSPNPPPNPPSAICGDSIVDQGEDCDGGICCSSNCTFIETDYQCRPAFGDCDMPEYCSGNSADCPANTVAPAGTPCGSSFGICSVVLKDSCDGKSPSCNSAPSANVFYWDAFNVLSFDSYTCSDGDVEGRLAAMNNVELHNFDLGLKTTPSDPFSAYDLVVGGNAVWTSGACRAGNTTGEIVVGGNFTAPAYLQELRDPSVYISKLNFQEAQQYYVTMSQRIALMPTNAKVTVQYGGLKVTCNNVNDTLIIFQVSAYDFNTTNWYSTENCRYSAAYIMTLTGPGDVEIKGGQFPGIVERLIYNSPQARNIVGSTGVYANLLAPTSSYYQTNGVTYGKVIIGNVTLVRQNNKPNCVDIVNSTISNVNLRQVNPGDSAVVVASLSNYVVGDQICIDTECRVIKSGVVADIDGDGVKDNIIVVTSAFSYAHPAGSRLMTIVTDAESPLRDASIPISDELPEGAIDGVNSSDASTLVASAMLIAALSLF